VCKRQECTHMPHVRALPVRRVVKKSLKLNYLSLFVPMFMPSE
jgi:hypothetical protein